MTASLRALLAGVIDYAGLFPPASLSLEQAVANFVAYRQSPEAWMLGRFICPVQRLTELTAAGLDANAPVAALARGDGSGTNGTAGWADTFGFGTYWRDLQIDTYEMRQFRAGGRCDTIEVKLSPGFLQHPEQWGGFGDLGYIELVRLTARPDEQLFVELPPFPAAADERIWREEVSFVLSAIQKLYRQVKLGRIGFKLRTGGLEAAAFPSPQRLAFVICACRDAKVCWKATAGLHHPLRNYDACLGCRMHGFVNVLVASVLATVHKLAEDQVVEMLKAESLDDFHFDDAGLRWSNLTATTEQIADARQSSLVSFGSCSFEEPLADLRELGLL